MQKTPVWTSLLAVTLVVGLGGRAFAQSSPGDEAVRALADRVTDKISKIRGLEKKSDVRKGLLSRPELQKAMLRELDKEMSPELSASLSKVYAKLGFMKPETDLKKLLIDLYTEQVAGFYDPERKELFLIGQGGGPEQEMVMAHELVHALQDQHFDLYRLHKAVQKNDDRALALTGLIEGDATLAMTSYLFRQQMGLPMPVERLPDVGQLFRMQAKLGAMMGGSQQMANAPKVITENMLFGYTDGASFCQTLVRKSKSYESVTAAFSDLPESSEQILHPKKYLDKDRRDLPIAVSMPDLAKSLGKGWKSLYDNVMGELNTRLMFEETIGSSRATRPAEGWGGDRFQVLEGPGGALLLAWVWVGDTVEDAQEFAAAYRGHYDKLAAGRDAGSGSGTLKIRRAGDRVFVVDLDPVSTDLYADAVTKAVLKDLDRGVATRRGYEPLDLDAVEGPKIAPTPPTEREPKKPAEEGPVLF